MLASAAGQSRAAATAFARTAAATMAADFRFSPARYRVGIWVAIASIVMLFTGLASAYIVRSASADDWVPHRDAEGALAEHRGDFD